MKRYAWVHGGLEDIVEHRSVGADELVDLLNEVDALRTDHTESEKLLIDTVLDQQDALEWALKAFEMAKAEGLLGGSPEADEEFERNVHPIRKVLQRAGLRELTRIDPARGVAGDTCEVGNNCGRAGCPECQQ